MKRTEQAACEASAAKRSSASGSRSIAISVPEEPSLPATRRAWPPSPNVQSTAVCPGWGEDISSSWLASTGVCEPALGGASAARPARLPAEVRLPSPGPRRRRPSSGAPRSAHGSRISSSFVDTCRDLRDAAEQRRSMLRPCLLVPQLEAVSRTHDHDLLGQAGVLAEEPGDHYAPGGVELGV